MFPAEHVCREHILNHVENDENHNTGAQIERGGILYDDPTTPAMKMRIIPFLQSVIYLFIHTYMYTYVDPL